MLQQVVDIVKEASALMVADHFTVMQKDGVENLVTSSDLAVQHFLTGKLAALLPGCGFICEEEDFRVLESEDVWIIDPIDGTANYSRGIADCCISVALAPQGAPLAAGLGLLAIGFVIGFPLPILVSLALNALKHKKAGKVFQTIYTAPHFISLVVLVGMLQLFFGRYGLVNNLAASLGAERVSYFLESSAFRPMYILSSNWQDFGWSAVIYIAALSNVDPVQHEAAMIDGATRFQRVLHVDIPAIMPMISVMLIMSIGGLMGVGYEKALLMQTDGNLAVSELIATYVYKRGLTGVPDQAYATAIGLFNSVINVVLLIIANTTSKRFSENSLW